MTWMGSFEWVEENFDPDTHRELVLEVFREKTGLDVRSQDLVENTTRRYYKPPEDVPPGRQRPEGWTGPWEFIQEASIHDYVRMYWTDKRNLAVGDYGAVLSKKGDVEKDLKKLERILDCLDALDRPDRDPCLWRFPGAIVTPEETPFLSSPDIMGTSWKFQDQPVKNGTYIWPCDSIEITRALFRELKSRKDEEQEVVEAFRAAGATGRPHDDWTRKLLVVRLHSVRKGRFAVPVDESELWPGTCTSPGGLIGQTLSPPMGKSVLENFVARRNREGRSVDDIFLSHSDITLLLVSAGFVEPNTVEAFRDQADSLKEIVRNDWRALSDMVTQGDSLRRPSPLLAYPYATVSRPDSPEAGNAPED